MHVTSELRPLFTYSLVPIIIICILIIILYVSRKFIKEKKKIENIIIPNTKDLNEIKKKYLLKIEDLTNEYNENKISERHAYQSLSRIIRNFIYEATNIKVQYYTLKDIKSIDMPILYELVNEYYNPEFSRLGSGDIMSSIENTRMVIKKWN